MDGDLQNDPSDIPQLIEKIEKEVQNACKEIAGYEVPKKLLLLPEPFSPENGILTPTLKLKRREVHKSFGDRIEALYGQ